MAPERVTVTIYPNAGEDGPLTVADGLRQILDFFDLLSIAQDDDKEEAEPDLSRKEIGSLEGQVLNVTTHYGVPAVLIRERLTGHEVHCVLSEELAERTRKTRPWGDAWEHSRILVSGEISYRKDGLPNRIDATDLEEIYTIPLDYREIADPNFTKGRTPQEHIDSIWDGDDRG